MHLMAAAQTKGGQPALSRRQGRAGRNHPERRLRASWGAFGALRGALWGVLRGHHVIHGVKHLRSPTSSTLGHNGMHSVGAEGGGRAWPSSVCPQVGGHAHLDKDFPWQHFIFIIAQDKCTKCINDKPPFFLCVRVKTCTVGGQAQSGIGHLQALAQSRLQGLGVGRCAQHAAGSQNWEALGCGWGRALGTMAGGEEPWSRVKAGQHPEKARERRHFSMTVFEI